MNLHWLLRMARWARNPPSPRRVMLVAVVIGICLILVGLEKLGFWPEWLSVTSGKRLPRL